MPATGTGTIANLPLYGTTAAARPQLNGVVLTDTIHNYQNWLNIQARVVRSTETGLLDFYWRLTAFSGGPTTTKYLDFSAEFRYSNSVITWADYRPDGLGTTAPFKFNKPMQGNTVYPIFSFNTGDLRNGGSRFVFVSTKSTQWSPTSALVYVEPGLPTTTPANNFLQLPGPA